MRRSIWSDDYHITDLREGTIVTQYDQIGVAFEQVKEMPIIKFVERPNVLRSLDHIRGRRVLDLACGTGYYSRIMRQLGAAEVVGVDISGEMIKRAVEIETRSPLEITYHVMDATELPVLGNFDRVNAIYLLNC
jgi:toxoflavin synthase